MKKIKALRSRHLLRFLFIFLATLAHHARAQDAKAPDASKQIEKDGEADPEGEQGPTVRVIGKTEKNSATLTDTPWIETPQSVHRVEAKDIKDWGVSTPEAAWTLTSGVNPGDQSLGSRYGGLPRIRGIQGSQTLLNGYVVPQRMGMFMDASQLEAIDFMKGSADMVDGAQTPSMTVGGFGGQINLISRRPKHQSGFEAALSARALGDESYDLHVGVDQPIIKRKLLLRMDVMGQMGRKFYVPSDYSPEWSYSTGGAIQYKPIKRLKINLRGLWNQSERYAYKGIPVIYGDQIGPYDGYLGNEDSKVKFGAYMTQGEVILDVTDFLTAEVGASMIGQSMDTKLWAWGTLPGRGPDDPGFTFDDMHSQGKGYPAFSDGTNDGDAQTVRGLLLSQFKTSIVKHKLLLGTDMEWMTSASESSPWNVPKEPVSISSPVLPEITEATTNTGPSAGGASEQKTKRSGVLTQYQAHVTQYVRLLGGFRFDKHEYTNPTAVRNEDGTTTAKTYEASDPYYRGGLMILPMPNVAIYGNYTQGRSPNFGIQDANGNDITESQHFSMLEGGLKIEVLESLQFAFAYYDITQSNIPEAIETQGGGPGASTAYELTGETGYSGYEFSVRGELLRGWHVLGSYSFTEIEAKDEWSGRHNRAPHTMSFFTTYQLPGVLSQARIGGGYRFVDDRYVGYGKGGTNDDRNVLPAYHIVDLLAEYQMPKLMMKSDAYLRLNVHNLLNSEYYVVARQVSETTTGEPLAAMLTFGLKR